MRRKRIFNDEAFYHVTSRTNDKIRVFGNKLGQKVMLMTLQNAKLKYCFILANFCVMPTHIHLLIKPSEGTSLSRIMQWIKTVSAKWWNNIHGSENHMWGERYFARAVRNTEDFHFVMNYIDQNPVVADLAKTPEDWYASGAFHKARNITGLIDLNHHKSQSRIELLPLIPHSVARLIPERQLEQTIKYYGAYAETIDRFFTIISNIPKLDETVLAESPTYYLHYQNIISDYFVCQYDGKDTIYGKVKHSLNPGEVKLVAFSLSDILITPQIKLDFAWKVAK